MSGCVMSRACGHPRRSLSPEERRCPR